MPILSIIRRGFTALCYFRKDLKHMYLTKKRQRTAHTPRRRRAIRVSPFSARSWSACPDVLGPLLALATLTLIGCVELSRAASIFSISDPVEFNKIIDTNSVLVTNAFDDTWIEGPVWMPQNGGFLI